MNGWGVLTWYTGKYKFLQINYVWLVQMSFEFFVNSLKISLGRCLVHCHAIIVATRHCIPTTSNSKSIGCLVIAWKFHSLALEEQNAVHSCPTLSQKPKVRTKNA